MVEESSLRVYSLRTLATHYIGAEALSDCIRNGLFSHYSAYKKKRNPYSKAHCSKVNRFKNLHVAYKSNSSSFH